MCWKQTTVSNPLTFKIFTDRKESAENCSVWQTCIANRIMGLWKLASILCMLLIAGPVMGAPRGNGKHIFILAGQSNMAGRGGVSGGKWSGYVPPESKPDSSILRLNAELKWVEAKEPLHADIDVGKTCGVGPGMAFANQVLRAQGTRTGVLGLVPCAVGGTRISEWARGTQLYSKLLRRAGESVKEGGNIRAILWYQGESDTVRKEDAEAYKANMERLILDLRSDLNISNLLIIQVALASGEGKFIEEVRKAQLEMDIPNVKSVDAKGLRLKADNLHLTTASQVQLGLMLAQAFLTCQSLISPSKQ